MSRSIECVRRPTARAPALYPAALVQLSALWPKRPFQIRRKSPRPPAHRAPGFPSLVADGAQRQPWGIPRNPHIECLVVSNASVAQLPEPPRSIQRLLSSFPHSGPSDLSKSVEKVPARRARPPSAPGFPSLVADGAKRQPWGIPRNPHIECLVVSNASVAQLPEPPPSIQRLLSQLSALWPKRPFPIRRNIPSRPSRLRIGPPAFPPSLRLRSVPPAVGGHARWKKFSSAFSTVCPRHPGAPRNRCCRLKSEGWPVHPGRPDEYPCCAACHRQAGPAHPDCSVILAPGSFSWRLSGNPRSRLRPES